MLIRTGLAAVAACGAIAGAQISRSVMVDGEEGAVCGCGKAHALMLRAGAGLPIGEPARAGGGYADREAFEATDLISNDLDFEVVPSTGFISGSNTMVVESRVDGLTQFTVMLRSNFAATATLNGSTAAAMSGPPSGSYARTITLDRPYNTGERFTVRVNYSGTAVSRGFGSIEFGTQNGSPIVASLSEAYYAATWFPAKDGDVFLSGNNDDKSTWRIAVTAPDTLRSVSNGVLEGVDTLSGGRKRYRWRTDYPMATYLASFCTTVYNTWTRTYSYPLAGGGTGTMPVEFNIYPAHDSAGNRAAWDQCLDMMAAYRPFYGEYPFVNEKYGIYEFPFGGGMEHQTNTGQGTFDEGVTAHELGHQWWGDNVTCKYWNDIWLNEGFATYTEALWFENKPGSSGTPALLAAMAARRPGAVNDSVYVYNADIGNMNRIFSGTFTYRKGGWVLHMLRHALGDATFFQGLRDYRAAFQGRGATTDDFRSVMSDTAGRDLTEYFQQWVYQAGAPAYVYGWQNATVNGRSYIKLRIDQTQDAAWGIAGAFKMPVDVRIDTASGSSTAKVENTLRSQYFLVPTTAAATGIVVDEFDWILNTGKTSTAYVAGPPKIAEALPAPGASVEAPVSVMVYFSDNVTATGGAFTVTGPGGPVPFTYAYNSAAQRATLTFGAALGPGVYTVGVAPSVTANGGQALDGEIAANVLPSGNGAAGGAASWTFTVANPCAADWNNDGGVDGDDVIAFFAEWDAGNADFTGDGGTDGDDVIAFFGAWDGGC